jgi:FMN reductase
VSAEGAPAVRILAVDCSPTGGGRTRSALDAVATAAGESGAAIETLELGNSDEESLEAVVERLPVVEAAILASPVFRAGFATPLKRLLDAIPRTTAGGFPDSPLSGKAVAILYTGASLHHFLALDGLRNVLAGFFAAHVLPPGLYVPRDGFGEALELVEPYAQAARLQGEGLVELALALRRSTVLPALRPQA